MGIKISHNRTITPEQAVRKLAGHGTKVTLEEAKRILDMMYNFSIIAAKQMIREEKKK